MRDRSVPPGSMRDEPQAPTWRRRDGELVRR
jgi:hypothetical protein